MTDDEIRERLLADREAARQELAALGDAFRMAQAKLQYIGTLLGPLLNGEPAPAAVGPTSRTPQFANVWNEVGVRGRKVLTQLGVNSIESLKRVSEVDLLGVSGCGPTTFHSLKAAAKRAGVTISG